jgi:hypothetical protein
MASGDNALAQNNKTPCWKLAHMKPGLPGFPLGWARCSNNSGARNSMPNQPVSDSQYFRGLAGKARAKADQTTDDVIKQLLLRISETYERVADRVEQRLPDAE